MKKRFFRMFATAMGVSLCVTQSIPALDNGLAETPPMGFNTWNWFKN